ncbi:MAG: NADP transhydrogenase subunit alpha, partial [Leptospira sp.]|nr:NADP transhydrogenase subunit alpha [Leptospira sp.]
EQERSTLSPFTYQDNVAVLHTDETVMPRAKRAWSSWNYRIDQDKNGTLSSSTIYWMNSLQHVSKKKNYFVNINGERRIDPQAVLKRIVYTHPVFTVDTMKAQKQLSKLNESGPFYFCGSYFKYGFHEDALISALELSRVLSKEKIWE